MRIWVPATALLLLLAACVLPNTAMQHGDAAAARGDWKEAERAYREAIDHEPGNAALSAKYQEARTNAISVAMRTAEACRERADLECIDREVGYVLGLDPSNVDASKMQATARLDLARHELASAQRHLDAGRPLDAFASVDRARSMNGDQEIVTDAAAIEKQAAMVAADQARQLIASADGRALDDALRVLDEAMELARAAAQRDSAHASVEREASGRRTEIAKKEIARLTSDADAALAADDFALAADLYERAGQLGGDVRVVRRAEYARSIVNGDNLVYQRSFEEAARWYQAAVDTGEDARRLASERKAAAAPRVYRVRFDGLMITPNRPGTDQPWVGDSWVRQLTYQGGGMLVGFLVGGPAGAKVGQELGKVAASVPPENQPTLRVSIEFPDGRVLVTKDKKGIYLAPDAEFWIRSNHYDTRSVRVLITHVKSGDDEDVASFRMPIGELVSQQVATDLNAVAPALQAVAFFSEPADDYLDGGTRNLYPVDVHENKAATRSGPKKGRSRFQLTEAQVAVTKTDNGGDFNSEPDPEVVIHQGKDEVFRSSVAQDTRTGQWTLGVTYLFAAADDQFSVEVRDADPMETDVVFTGAFTGAQVASGNVTLTTEGGSSLSLSFAQRSDGPR